MQTRPLGTGGPQVTPLALGCAGMSDHTAPADEADAIATIHTALAAGVTLLDTADFYGMGHNEDLIRRALRADDREKVLLSVKFGGLRGPDGAFVGIEGRPAHVKNALAYSLRRLGTDHVDIYRPSRLAPDTPIEDTIGAISELVQAGYVRHIGLSEVGPETIRRAHAVHPICDVQIEYSLLSRDPETNGILDTCRELGIGVTAYGVLAHGLLTGTYQQPAGGDPRAHWLPRFHPDNLATNLTVADRLRPLADARGISVAQLATAWVIAQSRERGTIVAILGTRRAHGVEEALAAADVTLTDADLRTIDEAIPADAVAGTRYAAPLMALLDSERGPKPSVSTWN
ncbi:aldo/keto reductase [Actinacidiphila oryziradicis]|uniref:aldo/keto reductase n=1 Tax=Actinacidiphila oryziradicis TaxID=2571141 RepID=UPI0023F3C41B|nr:aldo/keto reductase [Actinacidiphila oryziradicis]MCW2871456.1 oxidoreductase [Actinacidiphila oryziradicis]